MKGDASEKQPGREQETGAKESCDDRPTASLDGNEENAFSFLL